MSIEMDIHDLCTVDLLADIAIKHGEFWPEELKATVTGCISHAATLHKRKLVQVGEFSKLGDKI